MKIGVQDLKPTGNFLNKRYSIEMDFPDTDNIADCFQYLDEVVTATHMREYPLFYKEGKPIFYPVTPPVYEGEEPPTVQTDKKLTGFAHWESEINKCTTIEKPDGIEGLRMIAMTNPKLIEVFDKKLKQLKNGNI